MKNWSDRAEIFTRAGQDTSPGVFFFVLKNLSSFSFYDENTKKLCRDLVSLHENPSSFRPRGRN